MNIKYMVGGLATAGFMAMASAASAASCTIASPCDLGTLGDGLNSDYTNANAQNIQPVGVGINWTSDAGTTGGVRFDVYSDPLADGAFVTVTANTNSGSTEVKRIKFGAGDIFTSFLSSVTSSLQVAEFTNELDENLTRFRLNWDGSEDQLGTSYTVQISAVPVPAAGLLLLAGVGALGVAGRRKKA